MVSSRHADMETVSYSSDPASRASMDFQLLLGEAIKKVEELGVEFLANKDKLLSLRTRLEEGRFHLAVLGRFNADKSTC